MPLMGFKNAAFAAEITKTQFFRLQIKKCGLRRGALASFAIAGCGRNKRCVVSVVGSVVSVSNASR